MSASTLNRKHNTAAPPSIPKPYSIERRFRMMQAASSALALLLISLVLYWNQTFDRRLQLSLTQLHETLLLSSQIHARHESTTRCTS